MSKRLLSLVILLLLAGSSIAGMPLHSDEQSCSMSAMSEMDCCKFAGLQSETPKVATARLCCAIECSHEGTAPSGNSPISPKIHSTPSVFHSSASTLPNNALLTARIGSEHSPPFNSNRAYIRNLTLLI